MDISLSPDNEKFIQTQIAAGVYKTFSEAVNAALNIAINKQKAIENLNADIQKGVNSLEAGKVSNAMEFINELIEEYEQI